MRNNKGFSLVELIVVIAIMAILAAVAIPTFAGFIGKANASSDASYVSDIEYSVELANAALAFKENELGAVSVKLDENKKLAEIQIGTNIKISKDGTLTLTEGTATAAQTQFAKDVVAPIDTDYVFKTGEANSTYKLADDGKSIVPAN